MCVLNYVVYIVTKFYLYVELKIYFRSVRKMSSLFRIKNSTLFALRLKIVYCYTGAGCDASYIGKTSRHLHTCICEHLGISAISSRPLKTPVFSTIYVNIFVLLYRPSAESFRILTSGKSDMDILTREALLIRELRPSFNNNMRQFELVL